MLERLFAAGAVLVSSSDTPQPPLPGYAHTAGWAAAIAICSHSTRALVHGTESVLP